MEQTPTEKSNSSFNIKLSFVNYEVCVHYTFHFRDDGGPKDAGSIEALEKDILLRSICDTMVPKLVAQDVPLLRSLLQGVFPGADLLPVEEAILEVRAERICIWSKALYDLSNIYSSLTSLLLC